MVLVTLKAWERQAADTLASYKPVQDEAKKQ